MSGKGVDLVPWRVDPTSPQPDQIGWHGGVGLMVVAACGGRLAVGTQARRGA